MLVDICSHLLRISMVQLITLLLLFTWRGETWLHIFSSALLVIQNSEPKQQKLQPCSALAMGSKNRSLALAPGVVAARTKYGPCAATPLHSYFLMFTPGPFYKSVNCDAGGLSKLAWWHDYCDGWELNVGNLVHSCILFALYLFPSTPDMFTVFQKDGP